MEVFNLSEMARCFGDAWSPSIGDPTRMGWVTVIAYLVTALACFAAMRVGRFDRRFWQVMGIVLLLLCANKQLDLQSGLTAIARCSAQIQGWYDNRRVVQVAFIVVLLLGSAGALTLTVLLLRKSLGRIGIAIAGFALLLTYVGVRAAGFHHMDYAHQGDAGARAAELGVRAFGHCADPSERTHRQAPGPARRAVGNCRERALTPPLHHLPNIGQPAGHGRGGGHGRAHQMGAAAATLSAFEIAV